MTAAESDPERAAERIEQAMTLIRSAALNNTVNVGQGEYDRVLADHPDLAELDAGGEP